MSALGKLDVDAKTPQHPQSRKPHLRVELIDVARYEETYFLHRVLATANSATTKRLPVKRRVSAPPSL